MSLLFMFGGAFVRRTLVGEGFHPAGGFSRKKWKKLQDEIAAKAEAERRAIEDAERERVEAARKAAADKRQRELEAKAQSAALHAARQQELAQAHFIQHVLAGGSAVSNVSGIIQHGHLHELAMRSMLRARQAAQKQDDDEAIAALLS
jgi:hypothetical protein